MAEVKVDLEFQPGDAACVLVDLFIDQLGAAILVPLAGKVLQVQKTIGGKASAVNHEDEIYLVEIPQAKKPVVVPRKRCYHQATQAVSEAGCQNVRVLDLLPGEKGEAKPTTYAPVPDAEKCPEEMHPGIAKLVDAALDPNAAKIGQDALDLFGAAPQVKK